MCDHLSPRILRESNAFVLSWSCLYEWVLSDACNGHGLAR